MGKVGSQARKARLVSLDALRGFDMFWLIAARPIASGLARLHLPGTSWLAAQLTHTAWNGFTFYDFGFPLFIFISGLALVLSLKKRLDRGDSRRAIMSHVLTRTVTMFLLGVVYNGGPGSGFDLSNLRLMGVLQRLAICYFLSAVLVVYTKPRVQVAAAGGILVAYWAVLKFVPVPGVGAGVWTMDGNLAHYLDRLLLPGRLYYGTWDVEGLLTTIPAVTTCLLGVLTGHWLRPSGGGKGQKLTAEQRAKYLFLGGLALSALGLLLSPVFPINKKLWTSTFVLLTGGLAIMLMAGFYWLIDLRGRRRWAFPLLVIGMNSLFIYFAARFVPFGKLAQWAVGSDLAAVFGSGRTLFLALTQLGLELLVLFWLYSRKTFIRI